MKRYVAQCIVCFGIIVCWYLPAFSGNIQNARFRKTIIQNDVLYLGNGYSQENLNGGLVVVRLHNGFPAEKTKISRGQKPDSPYPFIWDIDNEYFFIISESTSRITKSAGFHLIAYSLTGSNAQELSFSQIIGQQYISIGILTELSIFGRSRGPGFFDMVALDEKSFQLYLSYRNQLTIWQIDEYTQKLQTTPASPFNNAGEPSFLHTPAILEESLEPWRTMSRSEAQVAGYLLPFEGPFHVLLNGDTHYILSDRTGQIYRPGEERLELIGSLAELSGRSPEAAAGFSTFIVDKDRQETLFYDPQQRRFLNPLALSGETRLQAADTDERHQQLERAVRAALDAYGWLEE